MLVLDANQRSALAVTRSLGAKGVRVIAADTFSNTLSASSKYCSETFSYASPYDQSDRFISDLQKEMRNRAIDVLFPMTEVTTSLTLRYREQFRGIRIPFPSFEIFDLLSDKFRLFKLAERLGVCMPRTIFVDEGSRFSDLPNDLRFPVVLKPYRSQICVDSHWIPTSVAYADSRNEILKLVQAIPFFHDHPMLIQEYIRGEGQGIFALYFRGNPIAFFAHRRIREKPPSGGVSVLSESIKLNSTMVAAARRLLDHVELHGVAMVEFKVSSEGTPYLMEVNARFWGSLQLAIDAGVDFPYLLYRLATGEQLERITQYTIGTRNRWLLGDLDHLYLRFKQTTVPTHNMVSKWRACVDFAKFFASKTRYEVNRWGDLKPFACELMHYVRRNRT